MVTTNPPDLRALHLHALNEGQCTRVLGAGDAEGLLWRASRARVLRRQWQVPGVLASELHALLDAHGRPLAWWQRSVAASWTGAPAGLPVPHVTLHEITCAAPGFGPAGPAMRARCLAAFVRMLAQVAGVDPVSYRHAWRPGPVCRTEAVSPAHAARA